MSRAEQGWAAIRRLFPVLLIAPLFSVPVFVGSTKVMMPAEPLLAVLAPVVLWLAWQFRRSTRLQPIDMGVAAFLMAALVTIPFATFPTVAGKALLVLAAYGTVYFAAFRWLPWTATDLHRCWQGYTIGYALLMVYSLGRLLWLGISYHHSYDMALPFSQGHTLLVAAGMPAFLYQWYRWHQDRKVSWGLAFMAVFLAFAFLSYSRLYWLALPLFGWVYLMYAIKRWRTVLLIAGIVALGGGYGVLEYVKAERAERRAWEDPNDHTTLTAQVLSIVTWNANDSNLDRLNRWQIGGMMFLDHPVTGVGLNNYHRVFPEYPTQVTFYSDERIGIGENAHNLFLGWLSEMGLMGLAGGLVLVITMVLQWRRLTDSGWRFFTVLLVMNLFCLGMIEDYLFYEKVLPYAMLCLAMLAPSYSMRST